MIGLLLCAVVLRIAYKRRESVVPSLQKKFNNWLVAPLPLEMKQPMVNLDAGFPEHHVLEKHWECIRDEAIALIARNQTQYAADASPRSFGGLDQQHKWQVSMLKFYGRLFPKNLDQCPVTAALLARLPRIKFAMFSIMEPGIYVRPHTGPFRGCLRYHLGLKTPRLGEKCYIVVNGQKYHWKDGEGVLFDDTFVHSVVNESDEPRIILFCDVLRELPRGRKWIIDQILKTPFPRLVFFHNAKQETTHRLQR